MKIEGGGDTRYHVYFFTKFFNLCFRPMHITREAHSIKNPWAEKD